MSNSGANVVGRQGLSPDANVVGRLESWYEYLLGTSTYKFVLSTAALVETLWAVLEVLYDQNMLEL